MAKVVLKAGADPQQVAKRLKASGIIMTRQLADGSYVAYKKVKSEKRIVNSEKGKEEEEKPLTTQEIHRALNQRAGRKIPLKHLYILIDCFGQPVTGDTLAAFLRYAW